MSSTAEHPQTPSLQKLLYDLFHDAETLLFQQLALLRAETGEAITQLLRGSVIVLIGLEIGLAGLVILIGALIAGMAQPMPLWLACVIIGTVTLGLALALIAAGRREIARAGFIPRRTAKTLHETREWFEDELG